MTKDLSGLNYPLTHHIKILRESQRERQIPLQKDDLLLNSQMMKKSKNLSLRSSKVGSPPLPKNA